MQAVQVSNQVRYWIDEYAFADGETALLREALEVCLQCMDRDRFAARDGMTPYSIISCGALSPLFPASTAEAGFSPQGSLSALHSKISTSKCDCTNANPASLLRDSVARDPRR